MALISLLSVIHWVSYTESELLKKIELTLMRMQELLFRIQKDLKRSKTIRKIPDLFIKDSWPVTSTKVIGIIVQWGRHGRFIKFFFFQPFLTLHHSIILTFWAAATHTRQLSHTDAISPSFLHPLSVHPPFGSNLALKLKSQPQYWIPGLEAQIYVIRLTSQSQDTNPSPEAEIPAFWLKSQSWDPNSSLKAQIIASMPKLQPQGPGA